MEFLNKVLEAFSSLVTPDTDTTTTREKILQDVSAGTTGRVLTDDEELKLNAIRTNIQGMKPKQELTGGEQNKLQSIRQNLKLPEVADFEATHPNDLPEWNERTPEDEVIPEGEAMIPMEYDKSLKYADEQATTKLEEQMEGKSPTLPMSDENTAMASLVSFVKEKENPREMGLVKASEGERFTVFDVPGSTINEKNIGWGIRVFDSWLKDKPSGWPKFNGVPLDVRKGITRKQAEGLLTQELDKARSAAASSVPNWKKMLPAEQMFWVDLRYNGKSNAFTSSPKSMAAAKAGYSAEAIIKSLDYMNSGKKSSKGLFLRRVSGYNQAARQMPGVPLIESISWGKKAKVKFAHKIKSTKVSDSFTKKVNKTGDGWFTISSTKGTQKEATLKIKA